MIRYMDSIIQNLFIFYNAHTINIAEDRGRHKMTKVDSRMGGLLGFTVNFRLFFACLVLFLGFVGGASAATLDVPGTYSTIQAAINAANIGDTINVSAGTYNENVDINKSVNLRGAGAGVTIVNASNPSGYIFNITANSVNISGFTVTGAIKWSGTGIYINGANYSGISNNIASNNYYGIYFGSSSNNIVSNNTAKENGNYDVGVSASSDADCNNVIENNTGSGDRPIKYFNYSVGLQDEVLSELILCNADNSNINNVTIEGSVTEKNNGLLIIRTDNSSFMNIDSLNNYIGISLSSSSNNTLTNNTANSNNNYGILLSSSNSNTLTGNSAFDNKGGGIYLYTSSSNNITDNNASNNNVLWDSTGIYLMSSSNNTIANNTANLNQNDGIHLMDSSNYNTLTGNIVNSNNITGIDLSYSSNYNTITNNTAKENSYDVYIYGSFEAYCGKVL